MTAAKKTVAITNFFVRLNMKQSAQKEKLQTVDHNVIHSAATILVKFSQDLFLFSLYYNISYFYFLFEIVARYCVFVIRLFITGKPDIIKRFVAYSGIKFRFDC